MENLARFDAILLFDSHDLQFVNYLTLLYSVVKRYVNIKWTLIKAIVLLKDDESRYIYRFYVIGFMEIQSHAMNLVGTKAGNCGRRSVFFYTLRVNSSVPTNWEKSIAR